jgi:hypothetical protein
MSPSLWSASARSGSSSMRVKIMHTQCYIATLFSPVPFLCTCPVTLITDYALKKKGSHTWRAIARSVIWLTQMMIGSDGNRTDTFPARTWTASRADNEEIAEQIAYCSPPHQPSVSLAAIHLEKMRRRKRRDGTGAPCAGWLMMGDDDRQSRWTRLILDGPVPGCWMDRQTPRWKLAVETFSSP